MFQFMMRYFLNIKNYYLPKRIGVCVSQWHQKSTHVLAAVGTENKMHLRFFMENNFFHNYNMAKITHFLLLMMMQLN